MQNGQNTDEMIEKIYSYANALITLQIEKKAIDEQIKELKADYKEEGIAVGVVTSVVSKLKAKAKKNDADIVEEDIITEKLEANQNIQDQIKQLIS